jgi:hypothetical protein
VAAVTVAHADLHRRDLWPDAGSSRLHMKLDLWNEAALPGPLRPILLLESIAVDW